MPLIWEVFASPQDFSPEHRSRLGGYRTIGSDGAGNPLCIEDPSGMIWLLDHENWFRSRQFVNSGVQHLAECLLAYMGEVSVERFRDAVCGIDAPALSEGTFWWHAAEDMATSDT